MMYKYLRAQYILQHTVYGNVCMFCYPPGIKGADLYRKGDNSVLGLVESSYIAGTYLDQDPSNRAQSKRGHKHCPWLL